MTRATLPCATLLILLCGATCSAETVESQLLRSTVRIRYERSENGAQIIGHGTAFAVDLSSYGFIGKRYFLTAAHVVLDGANSPYATIKLEIEEGSRTYWSRCKVLASDPELDVSLIEAGDEIAHVLQLDETEPCLNSSVWLAGSPRSAPVTVFKGRLTHKFYRGSARSCAQIAFDHGDSGGPFVAPGSGQVVGVASAGVPLGRDLDPTLGLYVPIVAVRSFLEAHRRNSPAAVPALARTPPPQPVRQAVALAPAPAVPATLEPASKAVAADWGSFEKPAEQVAPKVASVPEPRKVAPPRQATRPVPASQITTPEKAVALPDPSTPRQAQKALSATAQRLHVVEDGDNLTRIARKYGLSVAALTEANHISNPNLIRVGARLLIPSAESR